VKFLEASATQNLALQKEKFDVITSIQTHHYLPQNERVKATGVCFELLSPSGVLLHSKTSSHLLPKVRQSEKKIGNFFNLQKVERGTWLRSI